MAKEEVLDIIDCVSNQIDYFLARLKEHLDDSK